MSKVASVVAVVESRMKQWRWGEIIVADLLSVFFVARTHVHNEEERARRERRKKRKREEVRQHGRRPDTIEGQIRQRSVPPFFIGRFYSIILRRWYLQYTNTNTIKLFTSSMKTLF